MLNIFKPKPLLKQLIPGNFADIHSHVLPGIDDGAKNVVDSKKLLQAMKNMGFKTIITTPHTMKNVWMNTPTTIKKAFDDLKNDENNLCQETNLQYASEYYLDDYFFEILEKNEIIPIKENYVLVEMSFLNPPPQLNELLFELQLKGYTPILAHPERYLFYHNKLKAFEDLKAKGCLFQLNLISCVGFYGDNISKTADLLLKNNLIDFVGSDIHNQNYLNAFEKKLVIKNTSLLEKAIQNNQLFL